MKLIEEMQIQGRNEPEETSVPTVTHRPQRLAAMTGETIRRLVNSQK